MSPGLIAALVTSLALLVSRLDLAEALGLGDAEALFVAYALHPQPAYLDHPGLIGWLGRELGPELSPRRLHTVTALLSTLLPWVGVVTARAGGAPFAKALRAYFPLALLPELSIGTFAFSPDLPFAHSWLLSLTCASLALRSRAGGLAALAGCLGAAWFAALACLSTLVGFALPLVLALTWLAPQSRARLRTLAPWAATATFCICLTPLVSWWLGRGVEFGEPLRSPAWALRPLAYATPPFVIAGWLLLRGLFRRRHVNPTLRLLWLAASLPLLPGAGLALMTSAGDDWLLPSSLSLSVYLPHAEALRRSLTASCAAVGALTTGLGWCWLRTELPLRLGNALGGYQARHDTSNDYYAWGPGRELVRRAVATAEDHLRRPLLAVAPHPTLCAQVDVALAGRVAVGCDTQLPSDYDDWLSRHDWSRTTGLLFVTDSRFHPEPPKALYGRRAADTQEVEVIRFGRTVRRISVTTFELPHRSVRAEAAQWTNQPAR